MSASPNEAVSEHTYDFEQLERELAPGIYGRKEIKPLPLRDLVVLSQVRNAPNPEAQRLKESIATGELINQIDVAQLDQQAFDDYVDFVNHVWKSDFKREDFPIAEDGYIYLVVAGHTRVEAMRAIEDDKLLRRSELGLDDSFDEPITDVKLKTNITPEQIIALQLNENIHNSPPKERSAMAIVETYLFGLQAGKWANKAEFLRNEEHKFSRSTLNDALHFCELPSRIREFVLAGGIPYRAGVEIGRTVPIYREYLKLKYFGGNPPENMAAETSEQFDNGVMEWMGSEVAHIQHARQKGSFGGAVIKGRYEAFRNEYQKFINLMTGQEVSSQMSFSMADTIADFKTRRRRMREEWRMKVKEIAAEPLGRAASVLYLHSQLIEITGQDDPFAAEVARSLEQHYVGLIRPATAES